MAACNTCGADALVRFTGTSRNVFYCEPHIPGFLRGPRGGGKIELVTETPVVVEAPVEEPVVEAAPEEEAPKPKAPKKKPVVEEPAVEEPVVEEPVVEEAPEEVAE